MSDVCYVVVHTTKECTGKHGIPEIKLPEYAFEANGRGFVPLAASTIALLQGINKPAKIK